MYLCILFLPFLSFFSTILFGRFFGACGASFLSTSSISATFLLSTILFYEVGVCGSPCTLVLCSWFSSELFFSNWGFYFDATTALMLLVVSGVSSLVHVYATEYMAQDPHQIRFMAYLSLFTAFMIFLIAGDNFAVMFFGWEGVGLTSFLLIGFWSNRIQAGKSAIKAMLVNRLGDLGLVLGICSVFLTFKTIDYLTVFALTPLGVNNFFSFFSFNIEKLTVITLLLFFGCVGKSAQIGLHVWLPDAMEGPTPVSALIHAATLVTAGVFLLIRCSVLFENSPKTLLLISVLGALTCFFAATVGVVQNDLKRVIAYSTCSQLGYMVFSVGFSYYSTALFHLANHALFKALLFLSAGCIIHGLSDEQDMRKMGGIVQMFPASYASVLVGSLALVGFPFLSGFYSKDAILEASLVNFNTSGNLAYYLGCSAVFCTSFYSFRLILLTFINRTNSFKIYVEKAHEAPFKMLLPLAFLGFGSIFWGFFSREMFLGFGSPLFGSNIFNLNKNFSLVEAEFLCVLFKNIALVFSFFGAFFSLLFINCFRSSKKAAFGYKMSRFYKLVYVFLLQKWHFDQIMGELVVVKTMNFGYKNSFQLFDKAFFEILGATSLGLILLRFSRAFSFFQSGFIYHYSSVMVFYAISFITLLQYTLLFHSLNIFFCCCFFSYLTFGLNTLKN